MNTLNYFQTLCQYNQWMNEKLYNVCEAIPGAERKQDKGAFFRSIHGTLNHLLLADRVWLGRFQNRPSNFHSLDQELYSDFGVLRHERRQTDTELQNWLDALSEDTLALPFTFTSFQGIEATFPLWLLVAHLFNHQTHHRGQITTLMNQSDYDSGVTDLLLMPGAGL